MKASVSIWRELVGPVTLHHVLDADVLVGRRVDLAGDHQVLAQRDGVQMLFGGPAAEPTAELVLEDEVLDQLAVVAGQVVLGDEQDLQRIGDVLGQGHLRTGPSRARPRNAKFSPWSNGT